MIRKTILSALLALATVGPAFAAERPMLRNAAVIVGDVVHLSDLVDGLASGGDVPVFRAPDLGTVGTVSTADVLAAAKARGVEGIETGSVSAVTVSRASRLVSFDEINAAITDAVTAQAGLSADSELALTIDGQLDGLHIEPTAHATVSVERLSLSPLSGRFEATVTVADSETLRRKPLTVRGAAIETVPVQVYSRAIARGEVIGSDDIVTERRPRQRTTREPIASVADAVGLAVRRPVRAGQPVIAGDLVKPDLVRRNDIVTLVYETPGMLLSVRVTALDNGAEGDTVTVINPQSKRVIEAVVSGPGRVSVRSNPVVAIN